jgi:hypothetical protein
MAYLGYLVLTRPQSPNELPIVLSRPQFLVSNLDIVGVVEDVEKGKVKVKQVLYAGTDVTPPKEDTEIEVMNLEDVKPELKKGLGDCLLALQVMKKQDDTEVYRVSPVPPSPGFSRGGPPHVYPMIGETRAEYESIRVGKEEQRKREEEQRKAREKDD